MENRRRELTSEVKVAIIQHIQPFLCKGKPQRGAFTKVAAHFNLARQTVAYVWRKFCVDGSTKSTKTGRVGPRPRYTAAQVQELVRNVPQDMRSTMRDVAAATGLTIGTLSRHLKQGTFQRRSSRIKPLLSDANKAQRRDFCRSLTLTDSAGEAGTGGAGLPESPEIDPQWDVVHLDEKWFNADKDRRKTYLVPGETPRHRSWKSKRYIPKVMFLAAVARPRYDVARGAFFDGKVGMWPFVRLAPGVRNSRNRRAGTMVTKLVNVDAAVYRDFVINKVVPAIKASFPSACKRVVLQHDNATPHGSVTGRDLEAVCPSRFWIQQIETNSENRSKPITLQIDILIGHRERAHTVNVTPAILKVHESQEVLFVLAVEAISIDVEAHSVVGPDTHAAVLHITIRKAPPGLGVTSLYIQSIPNPIFRHNDANVPV
ncbi:Aste57867_25453 [Aphanomyces stellatus]|uniref:Aste57867_25453 protein n=1 Tax=Aphanomyces stellatus TaxID=120398 RepID=A0A485LTU3_9STRA|nr:hypothetical protein As57867_025374 [Aphanomyces stellatus]VFU02076.1 Aste57867_25453 [Aphanomyces stellatus]